jgi:hypothetical protein
MYERISGLAVGHQARLGADGRVRRLEVQMAALAEAVEVLVRGLESSPLAAWAAAPFSFLRSLLRFDPELPARQVRCAPKYPTATCRYGSAAR